VTARDRGSVTVEFAVALPVIAAVLGVVPASVVLAAERVRMDVAAAVVARAVGRGDAAAGAAAQAGLAPGAALRLSRPDALVCAQLREERRIGFLPAIVLTARGCAADGGR
jgi:hypothetical protein